MKKAVERERNKGYYRILHIPIWVWVFFVLPGSLTYRLYLYGPNRWHWIWLAAVAAACVWRGAAGRLPGTEHRPYVTYYGVDQANLSYRVVCYTAAWIDLLVPYALNLIALVIAAGGGPWRMRVLYDRWYWLLAAAVVAATWLNWTPRARRSTRGEGAERAWFYVAIWTVVPAQVAGWAMWRLGRWLALPPGELNATRLAVFVFTTALFFALGALAQLPRTQRYYAGKAAAGI